MLVISGASKAEIERALSITHFAFLRAAGRAQALLTYQDGAERLQAREEIERESLSLLEMMQTEGLFRRDVTPPMPMPELARHVATELHMRAHECMSLAVVVVLHTALGRLLCDLCRIGAVLHRDRALHPLKNKQVALCEISSTGVVSIEDRAIESWLEQLERESVLKQWDGYVRFFGMPPDLVVDRWRFDREYLSQFDSIRHDAVHGEGAAVRGWDARECHRQLSRLPLVLLGNVCRKHDLRMDPNVMFWGQQAHAAATHGGNDS